MLRMSKSLLHQLEHEKLKLTRRVAEDISARTGISADWLLRNDPKEPPVGARGERYTEAQYDRARINRFDLRPTHAPPILIRTVLLQRYAEMRDLFLRPEMHKHLIKFLLDLQLLTVRYDAKADYPASYTAGDAAREQDEREKPDRLFPGIIKDTERCYKAVMLRRKRLEREEAKEAKRLAPFLPREERIRYGAGTRLYADK